MTGGEQEIGVARAHERRVPHVSEVEDVAGFEAEPEASGHVHRARWLIFLPTLIIACLYLAAWLFLQASGRGDGSLAKLTVLVLAIGVPVLGAHAFLRYETIRVQVLEDRLRYHPGWPVDMPVDMPFELVESATVRRGLFGRMFGSGTLVLNLATGEKAAIADLHDPHAAKSEIDARIGEALA